jgi:hypothetical protein
MLVSQLALNNKTSYYSTAKSLIKKWHDKNLLSTTTNSSKVKTITNTNTNKIVVEKKLAVKRKSVDDDVIHSNTLRFEIRVIRNEFISYLILLVNLNHQMNIKMVIEINHHRIKNVKFFLLLNMLVVKNQYHLHRQQQLLIQVKIN